MEPKISRKELGKRLWDAANPKNEAVESQNEAVGFGNEAVESQNEAVNS